MFMNVSRTTPTTMSRPEDETRNNPAELLAVLTLNDLRIRLIRKGMMATSPRKSAPGRVMRLCTRLRYFWARRG